MYATQASIDPALAALMQTAQMVTPEGTDTVAKQVAQAAVQKMQPQGIAQGMPQARQDFQAAMPSVMRNMQQQQVQQMVKQAMQPQPAGIEGLPSNIRMAEGGVVGYASGDLVALPRRSGETDEEYALRMGSMERMPGESDYQYQRRIYSAASRQKDLAPPEVPLTPQARERQQQRDITQATAAAPAYSSGIDEVLAAAKPKPRPPGERPPAPAQAAPQAGIAAAIERPSIESAVQQARAALGQDNQFETRMRGIAEREEAMRRGMPDLNARGIAALEEAFQQRKEDAQRAKFHALFEGWKGNTAAYGNLKAAERQAEQENKMAILKFQEAQQARQLGEFDRARALEKEVQAHKDKQDQILQNLASSASSLSGQLYTADVASRDRGLDRAQQAKIEGARLQQQAEQNKQYKLATAIATNQSRLTSAYKEVENILTKKYANQITMFNMMSAEQLQKNPQLAESYNRYLVEKADLEMRIVKPIEAERNRLAAQIEGGGISRYDAQGNPIR